jgi:hypothetical protein
MTTKTWVNVARYHLLDKATWVVPWVVLSFAFLVSIVIFAAVPYSPSAQDGAVVIIFIFSFIYGLLSVVQRLPFGLALGVSRRAYYVGTAFMAVALSVVYGFVLVLLQALERLTGGWGVRMRFFRVFWILDGPWYLTWFTSFVGLTLFAVYGMWVGFVYRRWNLVGVWAFVAAHVLVLTAAALIVTWADAWSHVGRFFTDLTAAGLAGILVAVVLALLGGGALTMRRVTV